MTFQEAIERRVVLFYASDRHCTPVERRKLQAEMKHAGYRRIKLKALPWLRPDVFWVRCDYSGVLFNGTVVTALPADSVQ